MSYGGHSVSDARTDGRTDGQHYQVPKGVRRGTHISINSQDEEHLSLWRIVIFFTKQENNKSLLFITILTHTHG